MRDKENLAHGTPVGLERRLAAILSTDVQGYSRLMGQDEVGRLDEARAEAAEALRLNPTASLEVFKQNLPYKDPADLDRLLAALRKAGLK